MRRLAAALALLVIAGCSDSTSPRTIPFAFAISTPPLPGARGPQIIGVPGEIVVTARFVTPTPCYDLSAVVTPNGSTIDITITSSERGTGACVQSIGTFDYTLTMSPIAPGFYHVVVHHVGKASFSNTAFSGDVSVT